MSGTIEGGKRAAKTNLKRYGKNFYKEIGAEGGRNGHTGGFAFGDNGKKYGQIGGRRSRKGFTLLKNCGTYGVYLNKATNKKVKIIW